MGNVLSWAVELDDNTRKQVETLSKLWVLAGPVALMPDAHLGKGATIGSVIVTESALIPSAVGVDIGCGMIAVETDLKAEHLPDSLDPLRDKIAEAIPAGLGKWHGQPKPEALYWMRTHAVTTGTPLSDDQFKRAAAQLGTLGSGNHFFEVSLDERDFVWLVLHSGSRGIGNQLADMHIRNARAFHEAMGTELGDLDLGYMVKEQPVFDIYVADLLFSQLYALENRSMMMDAALRELRAFMQYGPGRDWQEVDRINCHHNYAVLEHHHGKDVWVTRKGAIRAEKGDRGVIPGSMGAKSYIVHGLGNPDSYNSCAHGAGRRMSRGQARREITAEMLEAAMGDRSWLATHAAALVDEAPGAYKDIDAVMEAQRDLVEPVHTLRQILNYKGVEMQRRKKNKNVTR
jgi:RNA-splicing ligase RtcB